MKTIIFRYLLIISMVFLSISALFGGISLIIDPKGSFLNLPIWLLDNTIFPNYLIPGIILLIFLGVFPAFTAYGLISRKQVKYTSIFNLYRKRFWAWTYAIYSGIILVLWIQFQVMIIGYGHVIQIVYAFLGLFIIILCLMPSNIKFYKISKNKPRRTRKKGKK